MRMNRRSFLELSAASAVVGLAGTGVTFAQEGDTLRVAYAVGGPKAQDPVDTLGLPPMPGPDHTASEQMFDQLARPADGAFGVNDEDFIPHMAESWTKSDDLRVWTFQIRKGVQFHGGYGEMTADDVVFSFERARVGGAKANCANIASVEKTGDYEVKFTLTDPDALFLGNTIFAINTGIISQKAFEERGAERFASEPIGSGPYEMVSVSDTDGLRMKRFEDYWNPAEKAKIANIHMTYIADPTARTLSLLSGEVDQIEGVRAPGWVQSIQSRDSSMIIDMTQPGSFLTVSFNMTRKPFDDVRVRRAIAHSIDRQAFVDALAPLSLPMYTMNPPQFPAGFDQKDLPEDIRYEYNPDKAKALLAEAGYPDGFSFDNNMSQREDYSTLGLILQEMMRAVGINMNLTIIDHTAYHDNINHDKEAVIVYALSYPPIPTRTYIDYLSSASLVKADRSGGRNFSHYGEVIPGIDDLLTKARLATDFDEYIKICQEMALQVQRDVPALGLCTLGSLAVRSPRIDLGFELVSGYTWWRLNKATIVS